MRFGTEAVIFEQGREPAEAWMEKLLELVAETQATNKCKPMQLRSVIDLKKDCIRLPISGTSISTVSDGFHDFDP